MQQIALPLPPGAQPDESERRRWLTLVRHELPAAAQGRGDWPIRRDHCFARVILDAVCGRPWREAIPAPAWRRMDAGTLRKAIALAEAIVAGDADAVAFALAEQSAGKRRDV